MFRPIIHRLDATDDLGGHAIPPSVNGLPQGKKVRSRGYLPPRAVSGAPLEFVGGALGLYPR
jgi:hypothetical protein